MRIFLAILLLAQASCSPKIATPKAKSGPVKSYYTAQSHQKYVAGTSDIRVAYFDGGNSNKRRTLAVFLMSPNSYFHFDDKAKIFSYAENNVGMKTTSEIDGIVSFMSSLADTPLIFMAVPGTFGSDGDLAMQHSRRSVNVIDRSIDELKIIYGASSVAVAAQSASAPIAAALMETRSDISCISLSSGVYDWKDHMNKRGWPTTYAGTTDPVFFSRNMEKIRHDSKRQIVIIADPQDRRIPSSSSENFALDLRQNGHRATLKLMDARLDKNDHHNLQTEAVMEMSRCLRRMPEAG